MRITKSNLFKLFFSALTFTTLLMPVAGSQAIMKAPGDGGGGGGGGTSTSVPGAGQYQCGSGSGAVKVSINIGCVGAKCSGNCNPIIDLTFALIRFLSDGVGIVIVGSLIVAGIQYSSARSDPSAIQAAQRRIRSSLIALVLFIFAYAILNYLIPAGFLS